VLLIKLMGDPDHNPRSFQLVTLLLGLGAIFYFVPYVLGVQASQVSAGSIASIGAFLVTNTNPVWAVGMAYLSIALIAVMGAIAVGYALRSGGRAEIETSATTPTTQSN
jgi:hypothetical protein